MNWRGEHRRQRGRSCQAGYTIIEAMVALAAGLLVAALILAFQRFQLFTLTHQAQQVDLQSTTRAVVDLFAREVRRTGLNATAAACGIAVARSGELRLQSDLDGDGGLTGSNEDVSYQWDSAGGSLYRIDHNNGNRRDVLVGDVGGLDFEIRYFSGTGAELVPGSGGLDAAGRTAVRRIRVELSVEDETLDPTHPGTLRAEAATNIDIRNRFFAGMMNAPTC